MELSSAVVAAFTSDIYRAVLTLSRSLAGRNDLDSLLSGLADSLRSIVPFDYLALVLHDRRAGQMRGHILSEPSTRSAEKIVLLPRSGSCRVGVAEPAAAGNPLAGS